MLLLLLTGAALSADVTAATEVFNRAAKDAFEWGNYASASRLLAEVRKVYEPQMASSAARAELASIDADRVLLLAKTRYYSDALKLGEEILANPDAEPLTKTRAALGLILVARELQRPELLDRLLQQETSNPLYRFALQTFQFERRLQNAPNLSYDEAARALEEAWKPLQGYVPNRVEGSFQPDGLLFTEAERFWWDFLLDRGDYAPKADRERYRSLYLAEAARTGQLVLAADAADRRDYTFGYLDLFLDYVNFFELTGDHASAQGALKAGQAELLAFMLDEAKKDEPAFRKRLQADAKKCQGTPLNPKALDYSRLEGSLYRLQARALQLQARLQKDPTKLLQQALALQQKSSRNAFLGLNDVRLDLLANGADLSAQLLADYEKQNYRPGMIVALSYQGRDLAKKGKSTEALASLTRAATLADEYLTQTGEGRDLFQNVYDLLAEVQLQAGQNEAAFDTLGRRAQTQAAGPDLPELQNLRGQTQALEQEIASKRAAGADSSAAEQLLASTRGEFSQVVTRLRQQDPRYEERLAIRPVNFVRQQGFIPENTAVAQYFPSGESLYIFLATRQSLKIHKIPVGEAALAEEQRAFRRDLLQQKPLSPKLYQWLIAPIDKEIADKPVLAVVPTGLLSYLPFSALSNGEYLVQKKQVVTLLKSSDLSALGQAPNAHRTGLLALGNPDGSLPAASQEVTEIAALFGTKALVGSEATSARLQTPPDIAYLHLATHGTLNSRNPTASQLLLASGGLTVADIYNLRLPGVRLATLSACTTALGETNPGADLTTLADAFSLAGASSVVASLWSVEDSSTRDLMVEFYRRIQAGESLAQALQGAQLKLLTAGKTPFQWAPFVLIGDWR